MRQTPQVVPTTTRVSSEQGRIAVCVEDLCKQGCKAVWNHIAILERGETIPELEGLAPNEISLVLKELKTVMACYEGTCSQD